jgi:hypothetical protein
MDENISLNGISVKNTSTGFIIELNGKLYKKLGEEINNGTATKPFYSELKKFVNQIAKI